MLTTWDEAGRSRVHPVEKPQNGLVEEGGVLEVRSVPDVLDDVQFGVGKAGGERLGGESARRGCPWRDGIVGSLK